MTFSYLSLFVPKKKQGLISSFLTKKFVPPIPPNVTDFKIERIPGPPMLVTVNTKMDDEVVAQDDKGGAQDSVDTGDDQAQLSDR